MLRDSFMEMAKKGNHIFYFNQDAVKAIKPPEM